MTIYISLPNKTTLVNQDNIKVGDVAVICVANGNEQKIKDIEIININKNENKLYYLTLIEIVKKIKAKYAEAEIINLGKQNIIVEYIKEKQSESTLFYYFKVISVCLILFFGGATTIAAFHVETQLIEILENVYTYFTGKSVTNEYILSMPYTLGIGIGIATFFNHIGNKKISNDPTPVEMQLTKYEGDLIETIVDKLGQNKDTQC